MISDEAVEAAAKALYKGQPMYDEVEGVITGYKPWEWMEPAYQEAMLTEARATLEAAYPIMLSHERQLTADAHRDAIVNRDTVDQLQQKLDAMESAPSAESVWDEAANVLYMGNAINQDHLKAMWERNPYRSQA